MAGGKCRAGGGAGLLGRRLELRLSVKAGEWRGGGATLLKDPELIYRGAKAMREAVPDHLPVTVKIHWAGTAAHASSKLPMR